MDDTHRRDPLSNLQSKYHLTLIPTELDLASAFLSAEH